MHQRGCLAPPAAVQLEEGVGTGRTVATQVGESEFSPKRTFPDEPVPLAFRESAPAEIASGRRGTPSRLGGFRLRFALSGKRGRAAEAALPDRLPLDWQIQAHLAAKRNGS